MGEVLIEGRRLDVMEGLDFSFNYSIADIREPQKRNTEFSKTIQCPGTKNNDVIFGQIYDVNISNPYNPNSINVEANFNPNKKAEARVMSNGVEIMAGSVQLRKIVMQGSNYVYEVMFIGKLVNIFSKLRDKELNGLDEDGTRFIDFSDLDHFFTDSVISSSWNNTTGYTYPLIDYGLAYDFNSDGERIHSIDTFRPAVFFKNVIDKIFDFAGFTYTSTFLDSTFFSKLIIPWYSQSFTLTDTQIAERQFIAETAADVDILSGTTTETVGQTTYEVMRLEFDDQTDPYNIWDDSTYEFTCGDLGYYTFTFAGTFSILKTGASALTGVVPVQLVVKRVSGGTETIIDTLSADIDIPTGAVGTTATTTINWSISQEQLYVGDTVFIEIFIDSVPYAVIYGSGAFDLTLDEESLFFNSVSEQEIFEGSEVYMNNFAPEVKMSDLLISLFNMFNLYVTVDPLNESNLIIETRDTFYSSGVTRDWTEKLARDKRITLQPLGLLTAREYIYTYKEDEDYYNDHYQNTYGHTYGRRRFEVDNDFITKTQKTEIIFSPTPLVNDGNSNRIIPKIYDADIEEGRKPTDINIRVLYYAGLITSNPTWDFTYDAGNSTDAYANYPYAGHLTNPLAPAQDINFGIPNELYYQSNGYTGALLYTNNNLYNAFYKRQVDELTDKDSKVMTGEFYLTAFDIAKLDFRDQILIDNAYWRINKINDYNPFKESLTKVELIKVLDVAPLEYESFTVGTQGTTGGSTTIEKRPVNRKISLINENDIPVFQGTVKGKRNKVGHNTQDFKIIGDDNFISDGSERVTILGSRNKVLFGADDVVIINTDDYEVTESNITIIQGKRQWVHVDKTAAYTARDRDFILADASGGAFTVTLPAVGSSTDFWINIKKTDSSANAVTISPGVSGFIDGSATQILSSQYDAIDVFCDGSNWYIR